MRILFDHQAFTIQRYGGISRYFYQLFQEFKYLEGIQYHLSLSYSNNDYIEMLGQPGVRKFFPKNNFKGKYHLMRSLNNRVALKSLGRSEFDLFHPTYYDTYFLNKTKQPLPFILTVYDMIHEKFASVYPPLAKDRNTVEKKRELLTKARRIIAISHSTKTDLLELYDVDPGKIDVVHLASSFSPGQENIIADKADYILFVGNRDLYKNFGFFVEVAAPLIRKYNLQLICAGGAPFSSMESNIFRKLEIQDRVIHHTIKDDGMLIRFYQNAMMFVFPSLYEGFGIPVLEAMQLGCPVLVSRASSFPEVAGDAALYFHPKDHESLFTAMDKAINDSTLRRTLILKGFERNRLFTWNKSAVQTVACYHKAV